MKIGIMQPYFFPYIGYWQLINEVDKFVVYDNIKFTKKSWIRRNRILVDGKEKLFSLPLKNDSDYLDIRERFLSHTYLEERKSLLNRIKIYYKNAPQFAFAYPVITECFDFDNDNLFEYILNSIVKVMKYLNINTEIIISSSIDMDHSLKNKYRVMAICKVLGGDVYVNPIGGLELYDKNEFYKNGIDLKFIRSNEFEYKQFDNTFVPNLSIIDVMMFNNPKVINQMLGAYELL